jgi:hypothetical protein
MIQRRIKMSKKVVSHTLSEEIVDWISEKSDEIGLSRSKTVEVLCDFIQEEGLEPALITFATNGYDPRDRRRKKDD